MYINTTINCGFLHQFNNEAQINELIALMQKNPNAKLHFELSHLGRPSNFFNFEFEDVEDDEYGYYICTQFAVNGKGILSWDARVNDTPWSRIYSKLYSLLVQCNPIETP